MSVLLETTKGAIVIDLYIESQPTLCSNFLVLCQLNQYFFAPFYNIKVDESITCGNSSYPTESGCYGANYYVDMSSYDDRITRDKYFPVLDPLQDALVADEEALEIGTVSFIASENTVGSEFCISLGNKVSSRHIPFGKVVEGFTILHLINSSAVDSQLRLLEDVRILQVHILHSPFAKLEDIDVKKRPLFPTDLQLKNVRLESLKTPSQDQSTVQALALELIGDLPHYKIKPSPQVLFIARLNKITTQDSLQIIFARFGKVINCNVIENKKSKTNYAFVEFETKQQAENAYSKLNEQPCVIDGNEVIIDFSQSVKKPKREEQ